MVNFGYGPGMEYWDESKKEPLANALEELLSEMSKDKTWPVNNPYKVGHTAPYVEVDQLYPGVRIRKITHLSDEQTDELIHRAEAVYLKTMGVDPEVAKERLYKMKKWDEEHKG